MDWLHIDGDENENHVHMYVWNVIAPYLYCSNEICFVFVQLFIDDSNMVAHSGCAHIAGTEARGEVKGDLTNRSLSVAKKVIDACNSSGVDHSCFYCERNERFEPCCACGQSFCRSCGNGWNMKFGDFGVIVFQTCNAGNNLIGEARRSGWLCIYLYRFKTQRHSANCDKGTVSFCLLCFLCCDAHDNWNWHLV